MATSAIALQQVSLFRNPPLDAQNYQVGKVLLAQCAYTAIVPYAIAEAAISQVAKALAGHLAIDRDRYQSINAWADSSVNGLKWAAQAFATNLFARRLVTTEEQFASNNSAIDGQIALNPLPGTRINTPRYRDLHVNALAIANLFNPTSVDPALAQLLSQYEPGDNANRITDIHERVYQELPIPSFDQLNAIGTNITHLLQGRVSSSNLRFVKTDLDEIARNTNRSTQDERYIKMVICIHEILLTNSDPTFTEILMQGLEDAFVNCNTRRNLEIESLFFNCVATRLRSSYLESLTPLECLTVDMMNYRMFLRNKILNAIFDDPHFHRHFQRKLNRTVFYLPDSHLDSLQFHFNSMQQFLMTVEGLLERLIMPAIAWNEEQPIITTFQKCNNSPITIYMVFQGLVNPKQGEVNSFKSDEFAKWLQANNLMNVDAFVEYDEDHADYLRKYKPQLLIDYLVFMGFLRLKPTETIPSTQST